MILNTSFRVGRAPLLLAARRIQCSAGRLAADQLALDSLSLSLSAESCAAYKSDIYIYIYLADVGEGSLSLSVGLFVGANIELRTTSSEQRGAFRLLPLVVRLLTLTSWRLFVSSGRQLVASLLFRR